MMTSWTSTILDASDPVQAWQGVFDRLLDVVRETASPQKIHDATVLPDRLLAESAWNLWEAYQEASPRTATALKDWWQGVTVHGRAVLVLDALSLRELPFLLGGAERRGIVPAHVEITGSELPTDTDHFARALGLSSRGQVEHNGKPASFAFTGEETWTDVLSLPFEDCASSFPPKTNVFLWHTWLDDLIHHQRLLPDQVSSQAEKRLQSDGFWKLVDTMRTGRRLVITSDHGYAVARNFSTELNDPEHVELLRRTFGASRAKEVVGDLERTFFPPLTVRRGKQLVVTGQRKWKVQGGFPHLCHGGASLLEVAVPFVKLPALGEVP
jgi:hypothetical protein